MVRWPSRSRPRPTSRCCSCRCCGRTAPPGARSIGGFLGLISSVLLTIVSPSVWEATLGNPAGSALVPLHLAGALLDDARLRRHLAVLDARPQRAGADRPRRLRGAAGALRDRHRRGAGLRRTEPEARTPERGTRLTLRRSPAARLHRDAGPTAATSQREMLVADDGAGARRLPAQARSSSTARPTSSPSAASSRERGLTDALVRDGERLGIFTTTDLRDALLPRQPPAELAVRDGRQLRALDGARPTTSSSRRWWLMLRHRVHRLVVREGDAGARRPRPARPDGLRRQPLAPDRAADRRGGDRGRAQRAAARIRSTA